MDRVGANHETLSPIFMSTNTEDGTTSGMKETTRVSPFNKLNTEISANQPILLALQLFIYYYTSIPRIVIEFKLEI